MSHEVVAIFRAATRNYQGQLPFPLYSKSICPRRKGSLKGILFEDAGFSCRVSLVWHSTDFNSQDIGSSSFRVGTNTRWISTRGIDPELDVFLLFGVTAGRVEPPLNRFCSTIRRTIRSSKNLAIFYSKLFQKTIPLTVSSSLRPAAIRLPEVFEPDSNCSGNAVIEAIFG